MEATPVIPEGLEPLATWDSSQPAGPWLDQRMTEASAWAASHIPEPNRFALNQDGRKYAMATGGELPEPATEPPVIVPLAELPPAHLLKG